MKSKLRHLSLPGVELGPKGSQSWSLLMKNEAYLEQRDITIQRGYGNIWIRAPEAGVIVSTHDVLGRLTEVSPGAETSRISRN